jgi:hypothetical protein
MSMKPATPARKQNFAENDSADRHGARQAAEKTPDWPTDMTLPSRTLISSQEIIIGDPISIRGGCGRRSHIFGRSQS